MNNISPVKKRKWSLPKFNIGSLAYLVTGLTIIAMLGMFQDSIIKWDYYRPGVEVALRQMLGVHSVSVGRLSGSLLSANINIAFLSANFTDEYNNVFMAINAQGVSFSVSRLSLLFRSRPKITSISFQGFSLAANNYASLYDALAMANARGDIKHKIPNVSFSSGQLLFANEVFINDINGFVNTQAKNLARISFIRNDTTHQCSVLYTEDRKLDVSCASAGWRMQYLSDQDHYSAGNMKVEGDNVLSLMYAPLSGFLPISSYKLEDQFNGAGRLNYKDGAYLLEDFNITSEFITAKAKASFGALGKNIDVSISKLDLDKLLPKEARSTARMQKSNSAMGVLLSDMGSQDRKDDVNVAISIDTILSHGVSIEDVALKITGNARNIRLQEIKVARFLGGGSALVTCDLQQESQDNLRCYLSATVNSAQGALQVLPEEWAQALKGGVHQDGTLRFRATLELRPQLIVLRNARAELDQTTVVVNAISKQLRERSMLHSWVNGRNIDYAFVRNLLYSLTQKLGSLSRHDLVIDINTLPWDFQVKTQIHNQEGYVGGGKMSMQMSYYDGVLSAQNIMVNIKDRTSFVGDFNVATPDLEPQINANIQAQLITIDSDQGDKLEPDRIVTQISHLVPFLNVFDGQLGLSIAKLLYQKQPVTNIKAALNMRGGAIKLENLDADVLQGKFNLQSSLAVTDNASSVTVSTKGQNIDCGSLLRLLFGTQSFYGYCSFGGAFYAQSERDVPWTARLNGLMQWAIYDMRVLGLDIGFISEHLLQVRNESELATLLDMTRVSTRPYQVGNVVGSTKIQNGLAVNSFSMSGNIASGTGIIQFITTNTLMNGLLKLSMIPVGATYPVELEINLKGTIPDMDVIYNFQKLRTLVVR